MSKLNIDFKKLTALNLFIDYLVKECDLNMYQSYKYKCDALEYSKILGKGGNDK